MNEKLLKTFEELECWKAAHDESLISEIILQEGRTHVQNAIRILNGYIKYLQTTAKKYKEPETEYNLTDNR